MVQVTLENQYAWNTCAFSAVTATMNIIISQQTLWEECHKESLLVDNTGRFLSEWHRNIPENRKRTCYCSGRIKQTATDNRRVTAGQIPQVGGYLSTVVTTGQSGNDSGLLTRCKHYVSSWELTWPQLHPCLANNKIQTSPTKEYCLTFCLQLTITSVSYFWSVTHRLISNSVARTLVTVWTPTRY